VGHFTQKSATFPLNWRNYRKILSNPFLIQSVTLLKPAVYFKFYWNPWAFTNWQLNAPSITGWYMCSATLHNLHPLRRDHVSSGCLLEVTSKRKIKLSPKMGCSHLWKVWDLTENILVIWKGGHWQEVVAWEVAAQGGSTILQNIFRGLQLCRDWMANILLAACKCGHVTLKCWPTAVIWYQTGMICHQTFIF